MPLRSAPLPRMAGDLTFMRTRRATFDDLHPDHIAILGAPIESNVGLKTGCRFGPDALRETSVYFGWHANPQFSRPVEIDARTAVDTSSISEQVVDIGDIPLNGVPKEAAMTAIRDTVEAVRKRGASIILLGGDDDIVLPAIAGGAVEGPTAFIQIGGRLPGSMASETGPSDALAPPIKQLLIAGNITPGASVVIAGAQNPGIEFTQGFTASGGRILGHREVSDMTAADITELATELARQAPGLQVHFDLSAVNPSLHGMTETPRFGGLAVPTIRTLLGAIGQAPVSNLIVTGLNPTLSGLSVVKTGQRLLVTTLLSFLYGRLGLQDAETEAKG